MAALESKVEAVCKSPPLKVVLLTIQHNANYREQRSDVSTIR